MRTVTDERGATMVIVATVITVLLGFGALVTDVGALYHERRVLQNGADAAALAVAKDCAGTSCGTYGTTAENYADANAHDGASDAAEVCGSGPGLPACAEPPTVPAGALGYVLARTSTRDGATGGVEVPFGLAQVFGLTGATVEAEAVAAWGSPGGATTIPLIFSLCEYEESIAASPLQQGPPFTGDALTIYFHGSEEAGTCPSGPSGYDLPGGFGWLDTDGSCEAQIDSENWVDDSTGVAVPNGCDPSQWQNTVVLLPIYDNTNGLTGSNGSYHVAGFAAFYVTGYQFSGNTWPADMSCPLQPGGSGRCIRGYFTEYVSSGGEFGGGDFGATIVRLVG